MRWDLTGSSLGDSPKESGSSLGTRREIAEKKTRGLVARLPEYAGSKIELRRIGLHVLATFSQLKKPLQGAVGHGHGQPPAGATDYSQGPPTRGGLLWQGPLQRGGQLRPGPARKGAVPANDQTAGAAARVWSAVARCPQGAAAARCHAVGGVANGLQMAAHGQPTWGGRLQGDARGGAGRRGGCPLAEWLPVGKGSRDLHRGSSGDGGAVRVKEG
ncbi:hypothetical protein BHM03_00034518 [Ensete ventricosum]|nr:hypothetical protein BHM03_00034518 [Ensete ventricosum]